MNIDNLNRALKYSRERLTVAQIHPSLRFTRLGAVLREHATEPSDVGELAYQALTSDHNQPLELMPLHLLRDKMQEEPDHPLAKQFVWDNVPDGVKLDSMLRSKVQQTRKIYPNYGDGYVTPLMVRTGGRTPAQIDSIRRIRQEIHSALPDLSPNDIDHSAVRVQLQYGRQLLGSDAEEFHVSLASNATDEFTKSENFPGRLVKPGI